MPVYSLADLLDLQDMGKLTASFDNDECTYTFNGTDEGLERVKNATDNAQLVLGAGIEAITDLLIAVEIHCKDNIADDAKHGALWLLKELIQSLRVTNDQVLMLDKAVSNQSRLTGIKKPN